MKTDNGCREWRELLGAYALGQLKDDEQAGLRAHLEGCAACRTELAELEPVARMLPRADPNRFGPAPQPSPQLGARIAATIDAERQRARQQRRRRQLFGGFALGGAAAAVAAVLLLFVFAGSDNTAPEQDIRFTSLPQGVSIRATLEPHAYGTEIHMFVDGIASGTLCRVSLRGAGGVSYPAGTFRYRWGDDSDAVLSSALDLSRTRSIEVDAGNRTFVAPVGKASIVASTTNEEAPT
jgi:hypothetical protein